MNDDKTITAKPSSHLPKGATLYHGRYRIDAFLASGGFGNTYRAMRTDFNETVAIKEFFMKEVSQRDADSRSVSVSHPDNRSKFDEQKKKFFTEAERMRTLRHPHIIEVLDRFEENNTAYYVMEYIHGGTLAERVREHGAVSESTARKYLLHILDALQTVHANGIYHLDIKPSNIMIDEGGDRAVLIDFGASKQMSAETGITLGSALCYTPGYAPSEQVEQAHDKFGPWTDLYALGGTFYFAMSGEKPPLPSVITEEGALAFHFPDGMSEEMRRLILWMMSPTRPSRPQTVEDVQNRITSGTSAPSATASSHHVNNSDVTLVTSGEQPVSSNHSTVVQPVQQPLQPPAPPSPAPLAQNQENGDDRPNRKYLYLGLGLVGLFLIIFLIAILIDEEAKAIIVKVKDDMVYVEGGTFMMGALPNDKEALSDETPRHQVTLSSFYISKYEVTQELWQAVMGSNPSEFTGDLKRPMERVSWDDCQEFIRKLNALTGENFRLPTEAEWEYAARGGQKSRGYLYSGSNDINAVAWYDGNSGRTTHPVGQKQPNELGLYDMSGNVWEWCQDWYGKYNSGAQTNPKGPSNASYRVNRGGSWDNFAGGCRASIRAYHLPDYRYDYLGLRLAL